MSFPADPGGVFESDVHRRVLGSMSPEPMPYEKLVLRLLQDQYTPIQANNMTDLGSVLADLEGAGYAEVDGDGSWSYTEKGLDALQAEGDVD